MRDEIEKIVRLGARLRKPSRPLPTYLTTTRTIYQGSEAGQSARRISGRYCVNRERRSRTCWPTLGSHGNRSWQEILRYLYGCCQLMLNFKATSSNQSPFEPRELHTLDNQSPGEQGLKPLKQILDISRCAPLHCLPISISPLHLNKLFARTVLGCRNVCKALNTKTLLTVFFLSWYNWESPSLVGKLDFELHIVIEARVWGYWLAHRGIISDLGHARYDVLHGWFSTLSPLNRCLFQIKWRPQLLFSIFAVCCISNSTTATNFGLLFCARLLVFIPHFRWWYEVRAQALSLNWTIQHYSPEYSLWQKMAKTSNQTDALVSDQMDKSPHTLLVKGRFFPFPVAVRPLQQASCDWKMQIEVGYRPITNSLAHSLEVTLN